MQAILPACYYADRDTEILLILMDVVVEATKTVVGYEQEDRNGEQGGEITAGNARAGLGSGLGSGIGSGSRGGLLPTTSHSICYSRVGQIAIFSHCQP